MKTRTWARPDGWSGNPGALSGHRALPIRSVAGGSGVFGSRATGFRASYGIPVDDRHPQAFFHRMVCHTVRFQFLSCRRPAPVRRAARPAAGADRPRCRYSSDVRVPSDPRCGSRRISWVGDPCRNSLRLPLPCRIGHGGSEQTTRPIRYEAGQGCMIRTSPGRAHHVAAGFSYRHDGRDADLTV